MYNILVCDDEKDIVSALEIYLTADGYQIFTAYNGRQAVDILNMEKPRAETAARTDSRWRQYSRQTARRSRRTARLGHRTMGQRRAVHRHRARSRHPAR